MSRIVSPQGISITPIESTNRFSGIFIKNDSAIIPPPFFVQTIPTGLGTTINVSGTPRYVVGKIENSNPFKMQASEMTALVSIIFNRSGATYNLVNFGHGDVFLYYDGVNTYMLSTTNLSFTSPVLEMFLMFTTPVLRDTQN